MDRQRPRVFVTDGRERAALAVVRGLGRVGVEVVVGAEVASSLAGASRYSVASWRYPTPLADPSAFITSVNKALATHRIAHIFPITDATMQVLAQHRDALPPGVCSGFPSSESYQLVSDKYRLMQLAEQLDVPIPCTVFVPDGDVAEAVDRLSTYPVIVKPGRSLLQVDGRWVKTGVHIISTAHELKDLYARVPYLKNPSLIQERVLGDGQGVFALCDQGRPCALFAHRRLREKPPAGGVSVFRESVELTKSLKDSAVRLLEHVKWHGVAMVEFKVDRMTGVPKLMEINGRFWGSLQLAVDAGLNMPYLLYQMVNGSRVDLRDQCYKVGTKSRWLLGDVDHLIMRLTKSRAELRLEEAAPSRWRCLAEFLKFVQPGLRYEVERLDDLRPALVEYRLWLHSLVKGAA